MEGGLITANYRKADCCEECKHCNCHIFCERNSAWIKGGVNMVCNYFERGNNDASDKEKNTKSQEYSRVIKRKNSVG